MRESTSSRSIYRYKGPMLFVVGELCLRHWNSNKRQLYILSIYWLALRISYKQRFLEINLKWCVNNVDIYIYRMLKHLFLFDNVTVSQCVTCFYRSRIRLSWCCKRPVSFGTAAVCCTHCFLVNLFDWYYTIVSQWLVWRSCHIIPLYQTVDFICYYIYI